MVSLFGFEIRTPIDSIVAKSTPEQITYYTIQNRAISDINTNVSPAVAERISSQLGIAKSTLDNFLRTTEEKFDDMPTWTKDLTMLGLAGTSPFSAAPYLVNRTVDTGITIKTGVNQAVENTVAGIKQGFQNVIPDIPKLEFPNLKRNLIIAGIAGAGLGLAALYVYGKATKPDIRVNFDTKDIKEAI
ncbi:MAG: hypothetical protein KO464_07210 [Candidatus Methanofastidiosum sp.]|nr:hypothetical protein [Methanofastidiosum sp.]